MAHFQDQSHINQVRDALWRKGGNGASVMVGSGFSRCALSVRPDAKPAPMLSDLAFEIHERLYPERSAGGRQAEGYEPIAGDRILSLAQEYETAFERVHLHQLLIELIRDRRLETCGNALQTAATTLAWCLYNKLGHIVGTNTSSGAGPGLL